MKWLRRLAYRLIRREVEAECQRSAGVSESIAREYTNTVVTTAFAQAMEVTVYGAQQTQLAQERLAGNMLALHQQVLIELRAANGETPKPDAARVH